jgi:hypothetical protein
MAEPQQSPKLTCGAIALVGTLALLVVVALQRQTQPPSWASTGAAAIAVASVFLIGRGVQNFGWGLVAAALLTLHPSWKEHSESNAESVLAGAVVLAVLAGVRVGWSLTFHPSFAWRAWPLLSGVLAACTGLAWKADARLGVLALALTAAGMGTAAFLALQLRRRTLTDLPARLNVLTAGAQVVLLPAASFIVLLFLDHNLTSDRSWWELLREALPDRLSYATRALARLESNAWSWPADWLVVPLCAVGVVLCSLQGWKEWSKAQPPWSWYLTLVSLLVPALLFGRSGERGEAVSVILTALVVLLVVFVIANTLRRFWLRLVLLPPDVREDSSPTPVLPPQDQVPEEHKVTS